MKYLILYVYVFVHVFCKNDIFILNAYTRSGNFIGSFIDTIDTPELLLNDDLIKLPIDNTFNNEYTGFKQCFFGKCNSHIENYVDIEKQFKLDLHEYEENTVIVNDPETSYKAEKFFKVYHSNIGTDTAANLDLKHYDEIVKMKELMKNGKFNFDDYFPKTYRIEEDIDKQEKNKHLLSCGGSGKGQVDNPKPSLPSRHSKKVHVPKLHEIPSLGPIKEELHSPTLSLTARMPQTHHDISTPDAPRYVGLNGNDGLGLLAGTLQFSQPGKGKSKFSPSDIKSLFNTTSGSLKTAKDPDTHTKEHLDKKKSRLSLFSMMPKKKEKPETPRQDCKNSNSPPPTSTLNNQQVKEPTKPFNFSIINIKGNSNKMIKNDYGFYDIEILIIKFCPK
jgi:hypothetical protein